MAKESLLKFSPFPKHPKFQDLTGKAFARLTVIGFAGDRQWYCRCICSATVVVESSNLKSGATRSCGCFQRESASRRNAKHGMVKMPEMGSYLSAKARCRNPNDNRYRLYGGRGIEFRFTSFQEFFAEVGYKPTPRHSLDRIDTNGHYERGNVRWATLVEQANNKRNNVYITIDGTTKTMCDWCRDLGLDYNLVRSRIERGWEPKTAFFAPKFAKVLVVVGRHDERNAEMLRLRQEGASVALLAEKYGISRVRVRQILQEHGYDHAHKTKEAIEKV